MSAPPVLEFWYEFASSYSYPAVMRVEALARARGLAIAWRPFLLGPVFLSLGWNDSPFNIYPPKGRYMWRDLARLCAKYGLPFRLPTRFPRDGVLAARVALAGAQAPWVAAFSRAVMDANFARDLDIAEPAVIADLLDALGLDAADWLARANAEPNKQALHAQTERAVHGGIFGAPTMLVGSEMFWGNDRLEDALDWACGATGGGP
jgi:2-hydroxychromene-2-carboxylate isomerase